MKKIMNLLLIPVVLLLWGFSNQVNAQGETCGAAVAVTPGTYTADGPATGGGVANVCYSSGGSNADWYSFTPTSNGVIKIESTTSGVDTRLSFYDGACGSLNCVANDDDSGSGYLSLIDNVPVVANVTYYIEWDDRWDNSGFDWYLTFTVKGETCADAIAVSPGTIYADGPATGGGIANVCYSSGGSNADWFSFTPAADGTVKIESITSGVDTRLSFYDGACGSLNCVANDDDSGSGYLSLIDNVSVTAGTTYYIEWDDRWDNSGFDWVLTYSTCSDPTALTTSSITATTATISWTAGGSETAWEYDYGLAGYGPPSGAGTPVTSTNVNLTGLTGATSYDWYVRADCGGGTYSNWVMASFVTLGTCGTWSVELYDTYGDGWNGGQIDLYINGTLYDNYTVATGNGPEYHDFPVNTGDIVSVDYTAGSYSTENEYRVYDAAGGGGNMLAEEGNGGATPGDVGDYTVPTGLTACPACPDPIAQAVANITTTSADLSWTEVGSATSWDIELGAAGFSPTGTPTQSGVTNPYTYGGLTASTSYDWYVRSDCGSNWVGPSTFTTACNAITALPYSEDFDGGVEWPACWSEGGDLNVFGIGTPISGAGSSVSCSYQNLGLGYLYSPTYDVTGKSNLHVRFFHYWRANYGNETQDGYFYGSPDGGTTVYTLGEWHHNNPAFTYGWNEYDISSWADGATDLTFWFELNMGNDWYWYIDYFGLQEGAFGTHGQWTGATDSDWHTASNWADGIVPFYLSSVTIPTGLTNYPTVNAAGYYAFMDVASDNTGDASLLTGGNLTMNGGGSATVHRYVSTDQWHLIGASTSGSTSGIFTDDWLESFDEASNAYQYIGVVYKPLNMGEGFALYDKTGEGTDNNFSYTGSLSTGESIALTRSAAGQNNGWNLVANPFPSAIDWNAASGWTKTNVGGSIYLYNNGQWAIWNGTTGTNGATQYIPMGQGFFVTVNDDGSTTGTLDIDYAAQVHNGQAFFKNEVSNMVKVAVNGDNNSDELVIVFDENATTEFDSQYDAYKLMNLDENAADIYAVTDVKYAINVTPAVKSMPVNVVAKAGTYTIGIVEGDLQVTLEDTYTGEMIDLNATDYTFEYAENQDARFVLYFGALSVEDDLADMITVFDSRGSIVVSVPASVDAQIVVSNVLGQEIANVQAKDGQTIINVDNDATYLVRVISNGTIVTEKVFVK